RRRRRQARVASSAIRRVDWSAAAIVVGLGKTPFAGLTTPEGSDRRAGGRAAHPRTTRGCDRFSNREAVVSTRAFPPIQPLRGCQTHSLPSGCRGCAARPPAL